jgi:hypothetical protein
MKGATHMAEYIGRTRIVMRNGVNYMVVEEIDIVIDGLQYERAEFTSVTGQAAFPPERLVVTTSEVSVVQECSSEAWVWQQRAAELHYARQLEELPAQDRMAAAMERLVHEGHDHD